MRSALSRAALAAGNGTDGAPPADTKAPRADEPNWVALAVAYSPPGEPNVTGALLPGYLATAYCGCWSGTIDAANWPIGPVSAGLAAASDEGEPSTWAWASG